MHMIGSLASGIAHNFNNIIGAILGYSEIVEPQLTRGTKLAQHIDEIRRAAERGRDLIDSILTFGRQRDTRVRPVQVRILFEEIRALGAVDAKQLLQLLPARMTNRGFPDFELRDLLEPKLVSEEQIEKLFQNSLRLMDVESLSE